MGGWGGRQDDRGDDGHAAGLVGAGPEGATWRAGRGVCRPRWCAGRGGGPGRTKTNEVFGGARPNLIPRPNSVARLRRCAAQRAFRMAAVEIPPHGPLLKFAHGPCSSGWDDRQLHRSCDRPTVATAAVAVASLQLVPRANSDVNRDYIGGAIGLGEPTCPGDVTGTIAPVSRRPTAPAK